MLCTSGSELRSKGWRSPDWQSEGSRIRALFPLQRFEQMQLSYPHRFVTYQAGDADSSRAPGLTSGLQGSVNVHRGALLLVPRWRSISSFVFYIRVQCLRKNLYKTVEGPSTRLIAHSMITGSHFWHRRRLIIFGPDETKFPAPLTLLSL